MPSISALHKSDIGVGRNSFSRLWLQADKWIIRGVDDQCWQGDPMHDVCRRCPRIVIVRSREAAIVCCDFVIESAQAGDSSQTRNFILLREQFCLPPKTPEQLD